MTHPCPGCEAVCPNYVFSCMDCWRLLDRKTQVRVVETASLPLDEPARINARRAARTELEQARMFGRPKS